MPKPLAAPQTGARAETAPAPLQASNVRPFTKVSARPLPEEIDEKEEDAEDEPRLGPVVERRDLVKGYEVEKGKFVPEPGTLALLGVAVAGLASLRRHKQ